MLVVIVIGAVFLGSRMWHSLFGGAGDDFAGDGVNDVVIQVHDGDSTTAIGQTLHDNNVVANVKVFVEAADGNAAISSIQPGFYKVRTEIPAADAVERLADPDNRVGKLVIPEGRQLDDVRDVKTDAVTDGILTLISNATCVELDGDRRCVAAEDLKNAASGANLAETRVCRSGRRSAVDGAGLRSPPAGGADRTGHVEHRPVGASRRTFSRR